jgi:hypothetical protein
MSGKFRTFASQIKIQGDMKFSINGREYEDYELSNAQIVELLEGDHEVTDMGHDFLMRKVYERFKSELCPRKGEDTDDVFARFFGNYVNGKCHDKKKVAKLMCNEHRYLQNEMFLLFMKFVEKLCENAKEGRYDGRNQYACNTSKIIINALDARDWPH